MRNAIIITALLAVSCGDRAPVSGGDAGLHDTYEADPTAFEQPKTYRVVDAAEARPVDEASVTPAVPIAGGTCQVSLSCATRRDCERRGLLDCSAGQCVMCREDADCPDFWSCDPATGWCRLCGSDADCTIGGTQVGTGKCEPTVGQCVRCDSDDDCAGGALPQSGRCSSVATLIGTARICAGCETDADCFASQYKRCETATKTCSRCASDAECCPIYQPSCGLSCDASSGQCLCSSDQQCADAYNSPLVECL